jgi:hypothetical protein
MFRFIKITTKNMKGTGGKTLRRERNKKNIG